MNIPELRKRGGDGILVRGQRLKLGNKLLQLHRSSSDLIVITNVSALETAALVAAWPAATTTGA